MKRFKQIDSTPQSGSLSHQELRNTDLEIVTGGGPTKIEVDVGTPVNLPGGWRDILNDILG